MHTRRHIVLLLCLLTGIIAIAQEAKKPPLAIVATGDGELEVSFHFSGVGLTSAGWGFHELTNDCLYLDNGPVGSPNLPTLSTLIRLPEGSTLEVSDLRSEERITEGFFNLDGNRLVAPITEGWFKDHEWPGYKPNAEIYSTNGWYRGGDLLEVEHLGHMGREEVYRLTLRPVAYNPVRGDLKEWTTVEARLKVGGGNVRTREGKETILIVSRPEFRNGIQPFAQWKRQEGYAVEELYVNTHKRDSIKEQMRPYFAGANTVAPIPDYILLVGDAAQIQAFPGRTSLQGAEHTTDLYYADFTGDYLPEALLGRWPVNDTTELRIVVEKTLRYEQFRDMDTLQLKRMLLVAGHENTTPAPLTTNGQVNYLKQEIKVAHPEIDTVCYHNPQSGSLADSIVADLGRGAGLLNYTAHCTEAGWTSPQLTIGRVEGAHETQPMVYINNCCKSNSFGGTGFGEQLLRLPVGGGVGVIGATNSTLWNEDYFWAVGPKHPIVLTAAYDSAARGAFDALVGRQPDISTMGELLAAGNLAVTAYGSSYDRFYWEVYCLLGDPTLKPWIGVPEKQETQPSEGLYNGQSQMAVRGNAGTNVTVMQGGEVIGHAVIGTSGNATINLDRALDTLPVVITATGTHLWPRIDTLSVGMVERGVALRNVTVNDSAVHCTVENIGNLSYDSLRLALGQSQEQLSGALIAEHAVTIDLLPPHSQTEVALPVTVVETGQLPQWQATLSLWSDSMECRHTITHPYPVAYPTLGLRLLDANVHEARRVLPGHTYQLAAKVTGLYDSVRLEAESYSPRSMQSTNDTTLTFITADSLCALAIGGTLHLGHWSDRQRYWLEPGNRIESFEHGFASHPWKNASPTAWTIDSTESHSGRFSARSGTIGDGMATQLCLEVEMPFRDTISYWVKTSTEGGGDKMVFSVDGYGFIPEAWGAMDWDHRIHVLNAGRHTLCWRYSKDGSDSRGSDCVWIDDLQIPLALWDTAYVWDCQMPTTDIRQPQEATPSVTLYPNPATRQVTIAGPQGTRIHVSDALGRTITTITLTAIEPYRWDTTALPAGIYFITSTYGNRQNTQKLILLNH